MEKGTKVRIKNDPSRIGYTTGNCNERAGRIRWEVDFIDGSNGSYLETALETVETKETPLSLLKKGRFGHAEDLRLQLTHRRLNGRLADLIYSMGTTNTDFYSYQFKPVLNFLESVSNGLLIADEVGLGKTIEAGLIWTELRSRFDFKRLLIVCPAMLRQKWQMELELRFGIDAEIVSADDVLDKLKKQQINKKPFAMIASMQGLRPQKEWEKKSEAKNTASKLARFLDEHENEEPLFDLVIIDEAHYLRNAESMTSKLGRILRNVTDYILLLSATPINLKNTDLYQLLRLVDGETFYNEYAFDHILQANAPLIEARDKILRTKISQQEFVNLLKKAQKHYLLHNNHQLKNLLAQIPTTEQLHDNDFRSQLARRLENINLLSKAVSRTRKRDVQEWRTERCVVAEYIDPTSTERQFYEEVTNFIRQYCVKNAIAHDGFLLATPQRQISSSMPAALQAWRAKIGVAFDAEQNYEDFGFESENENGHENQKGVVVQELVSLSRRFDLNELKKFDSKYKRLKEKLKEFIEQNPTEKIILFAYFRPTLAYLQDALQQDGIECRKLVGGMTDNKQEFIDEFRDSTAKVLLLSEVASEGIDLQFCRVLVNYDLPWNPMKVEQRIGRIDRLGQKAKTIVIWNLFYSDTIDARIYKRLFERLDIFKYALGDLEDVLGKEIRELTNELISQQLTHEEEDKRIEQTEQAIANRKLQDGKLEDEAVNLVAHGDYILNHVKTAKELNRFISAKDIWEFVRDFLQKNYTGCEFNQLDAEELKFNIRLSEKAKFDLSSFIKQKQLEGFTHLVSNDFKPICCKFENKVSGKNKHHVLEIISQFHPLTRFVSHSIEQNLKNGLTHFHSVVAVKLASNQIKLPTGVYVFHSQVWSIRGLRDIEKVYFSAKPLLGDKFLSENNAELLVTTAASNSENWFEATNTFDLQLAIKQLEHCQDNTEDAYNNYVEQLKYENEDRATMQKNTIASHKEKEVKKYSSILREHELQGRSSLVKATQGKIDKIQNNAERKLAQISEREKLCHSHNELVIGIINIF